MRHRFFMFFLLVLGFHAASANYRAPVKSSLKTAPQQKIDRLSVDFAYSGMTDLLEQREKTFSHSLSISTAYIWSRSLTVGGFADFEYESIGRDIVNENDPLDQPGVGDVGIFADNKFLLTKDLKLNASYSLTFPTSPVSRDEGYKGILSAKAAIPYEWSRATVKNSMGLSYIANTFENSQLTGLASPDWTINYALGLSYKISKDWMTGASVDIRSTHFMDGFNRFRAGNSLFVSYSYSNWNSRLTYSNGIVPDRINSSNPSLDSFEVWQLDQYRQIVGWDLSCSF